MSQLNPEERLFIDGALVPAKDGQTYNVINPATEEMAGIVAAASLADGDRALAAARRCFDESDWSTNRTRRLSALAQFRDGLKAVAEEWRPQIVAESGCPIAFTYGPLLDSCLAEIDYSLKMIETYPFEREIEDIGSMGGPARRLVCKEAAGVVGAITPWNAPVQTNLQKIVPALGAGCTVVLKAAHDTPWSATMLGRAASQCPDFPAGAFNVLTSAGDATLGAMLTGDPRVDVISFTGSTATGRRVMESAARTIKKPLLELGGKSAMIFLDDAEVPAGPDGCQRRLRQRRPGLRAHHAAARPAFTL